MTDGKAPEAGIQGETATHMAHDALVKFMWADVTRAKAMLRACLPPEVAKRCNWDALRLEDGSFTDPSLKATRSDLLFRTTVGEEEALLYLVFEHKSDEDGADILQLHGYVQRVLEGYQRGRQAKRAPVFPLPLILPMVLHHSERGWSGPTDWMAVGEGLDVQQIMSRILELVPKAKGAIMTAAEKLIAQGRDEGRDEGRAEGRSEILLMQLKTKFGAVPAELESRVQRGSMQELDGWASRVLFADSVEAVFAKQ